MREETRKKRGELLDESPPALYRATAGEGACAQQKETHAHAGPAGTLPTLSRALWRTSSSGLCRPTWARPLLGAGRGWEGQRESVAAAARAPCRERMPWQGAVSRPEKRRRGARPPRIVPPCPQIDVVKLKSLNARNGKARHARPPPSHTPGLSLSAEPWGRRALRRRAMSKKTKNRKAHAPPQGVAHQAGILHGLQGHDGHRYIQVDTLAVGQLPAGARQGLVRRRRRRGRRAGSATRRGQDGQDGGRRQGVAGHGWQGVCFVFGRRGGVLRAAVLG